MILTSGWITPAGWVSPIAAAVRCRAGRRLRRRSKRLGNVPGAALRTITGLSYDKLRGGPGIQWPCTDEAPDGTERLYVDHHFRTDDDQCETYGHDLTTGASVTADEHAASRFDGRARLKAADWVLLPKLLTTRTRCIS